MLGRILMHVSSSSSSGGRAEPFSPDTGAQMQGFTARTKMPSTGSPGAWGHRLLASSPVYLRRGLIRAHKHKWEQKKQRL